MNGVEPEFFFETRFIAKPRLEILIGSLPITPNNRGFADGATFGAIIVDIKWLKDKFDFARAFFEIV